MLRSKLKLSFLTLCLSLFFVGSAQAGMCDTFGAKEHNINNEANPYFDISIVLTNTDGDEPAIIDVDKGTNAEAKVKKFHSGDTVKLILKDKGETKQILTTLPAKGALSEGHTDWKGHEVNLNITTNTWFGAGCFGLSSEYKYNISAEGKTGPL